MFPTDMSTTYGVVQPGTSRYCPRDVCGSRLYWKVPFSSKQTLLSRGPCSSKGMVRACRACVQARWAGRSMYRTTKGPSLPHSADAGLGALQIAGQMKVSADMHWMYIHTM